MNCPAGMRAFGGGGYFRAANGTPSTSASALYANHPSASGRSWTVSALNMTFTDTLVVSTRCAFQSTSTRLLEFSYPIVPAVPTTEGQVGDYARCPAGFLPISGGASLTQDGASSAAQPRLVWSVLVDNGQIGWFALAPRRESTPACTSSSCAAPSCPAELMTVSAARRSG